MTKSALILFFLLPVFFFSQKFSKIDFDSIKKVMDADAGSYGRLAERLKKLDSALTAGDLKMLYYGQVFSSQYDPYASAPGSDEFLERYKARKFSEAIPFGEKMLSANPVNMGLLYRLAVCYRETGNALMKKRCTHAFNGFIRLLESSGDGRSCESAFVVTSVADEYILLTDLELEDESQSLIGNCDMFKVKKSEKFPHKKIYFNIYWSLKKMSDLFQEK